MVKQSLCAQCGRCRTECGHEECRPYGRCLHACPNGCLTFSGERIATDALAARLSRYRPMLDSMGGGVTFSGGEPLLQADFVMGVAEHLQGMHLALQTSGYASEELYRRLVSRMDYVMQDLKLADDATHRRHTGVSNASILRNVAWLKQSGIPYILRVPLIPGITDTEENLRGLSAIAGDAPVELLRYNTMAGAKYDMLGLSYHPELTSGSADAPTRFFAHASMK